MGQVHLGFDPVLERYVAIKQITQNVLQHPENATLLAYFQREAKVVASLQHPNIIQIYEYGTPPGESAYIVTEFVDGVTFEELADDLGRLPITAALGMLHAVAEALEFAHERGIIHRDLKPGNVMLSRHGRVFLMDFGLAKPLGGSGLKSMIIGSPAFMAPEQVEGVGTDVRTDVFSFGLLAYAMASGRLFFSATAPKAFAEILNDEYPTAQTLEAIADPALRGIVEACVQRAPEERFESMAPVLAAIETALGEHGVLSASRETKKWAERWADLMPQQFTMGPIAEAPHDTTPAAARGFNQTLPSARVRLPPNRAVPSISFGSDMSVSDGLADLSRIDATPTRLEALEAPEPPVDPSKLISALDVTLPAGPMDFADDEPTIADIVQPPAPESAPAQPEVAPAEPKAEPLPEVIPVARMAPPDPSPELMRLRAIVDGTPDPNGARRLLALVASWGGQMTFTEVRDLMGEAAPSATMQEISSAMAELAREGALEQRGDDAIGLSGPATPGVVDELLGAEPVATDVRRTAVARQLNQAQEAHDAFDPHRAIELLDRALALVRADDGLPPQMAAHVVLGRADLAAEQHDTAFARALYEEALARVAEDSEIAMQARFGLGWTFFLQDRLDRANRWISAGLDAARDSAASGVKTGVWTARWQRLRGLVRLRHGELRSAHVDLGRALSNPELKERPRDRALIQLALAEVLKWMGRTAEARNTLSSALAVFEDEGDIGSTVRAQALMGWIELGAGRLEEAQDLLEQARGSAKPAGARAVLAQVRVWLGEVNRLRGDLDEAERSIRRGLMEFEALRESHEVALARAALATVLCDAGSVDEAERLWEEADRALENDPLDRMTTLLLRARLSFRVGDYAGAAGVVSTAIENADGHGVPAPFAQLVRAAISTVAGDGASAALARQTAEEQYAKQLAAARMALDERDLSRWTQTS